MKLLEAQTNANIDKFIEYINKKHGYTFKGYWDLHDYSVTNFTFWKDVMEFCKIKYHGTIEHIVDDIPMGQIPTWFNSIKFNYCENIFANCDKNAIALYHLKEDFDIKSMTYQQLYDQVSLCQQALRQFGITSGDVICAYCPNSAITFIWFLACNSLGAVWSSTSCDFGTTAVYERFHQIKPKLLFSVNAVLYNSKIYSQLDKLEQLKSLGCPIIVDEFITGQSCGNFQTFNSFISPFKPTLLSYDLLPFHSPIYILFSSGTTGQPKCIVHGNGAFLQHMKEHFIQGNITSKDIVFQYTTTGWMMWNWLISCAAITTIVLYDGSPFKPNPTSLWELVNKLKITVFGTSAKYLQTMQQMKLHPNELQIELSQLRTITSTGSPLMPESYDFVFKHIKPLLLGSITGGTDIVSCFCGYTTNLPLHKGEIQCSNLGMAMAAFIDGKPVFDTPGDLVCTRPFPSMPISFLNGFEKYKSSYFHSLPNIWFHGDFVQINSQTKGVVMLGRSDGTLKPGGVRFGSAELYKITEQFDFILDALAVGQTIENDERVILFIKMVHNTLTEQNIKEIKVKIRTELSPRHVPAIIMQCPDIPVILIHIVHIKWKESRNCC